MSSPAKRRTSREVFLRRHSKTGNLCLLATPDGSPWISPMEPGFFEGRLVLVGMPNTSKFRDLERDPRFELHTATVDPYVDDGDAKIWGEARNVQDTELHARFSRHLFDESGMDLRGPTFDRSSSATWRAPRRWSSETVR
jgi:Pyridoxamine 5'-phosphate oxidase